MNIVMNVQFRLNISSSRSEKWFHRYAPFDITRAGPSEVSEMDRKLRTAHPRTCPVCPCDTSNARSTNYHPVLREVQITSVSKLWIWSRYFSAMPTVLKPSLSFKQAWETSEIESAGKRLEHLHIFL